MARPELFMLAQTETAAGAAAGQGLLQQLLQLPLRLLQPLVTLRLRCLGL
jgi:hypothetical protein